MKMASDDETMMSAVSHFPSIMMLEDDNYEGDGYDDHHRDHPHSMSRLSTCTATNSTVRGGNNRYQDYEEDDDHTNGDLRCAAAMGMFLSRLSIESSDVGIDADVEVSDDEKEGEGELVLGLSPSDDSDKELPQGGSFSLPATPKARRTARAQEYYASENDAAEKGIDHKQKRTRRTKRRRRRITRERWLGRYWEGRNSQMEKNGVENDNEDGADDKITASSEGNSGESEGGSGGGLIVIAKPKGGKRQLCMDLEEVKACRDLGFELEHHLMMLETPSPPPPISIPACASPNRQLDASSPDCSSPIASWRISSPGDDPRDVKARLKVWAQAVALASTSWQSS